METKFPELICIAIGAQFINDGLIAFFGFELTEGGIALTREKHYRLVPPEALLPEDLERYRNRTPNE